jgi:hypothetical protein
MFSVPDCNDDNVAASVAAKASAPCFDTTHVRLDILTIRASAVRLDRRQYPGELSVRCVHEFHRTRSMQWAQQEAYSHCDAALDFGSAGWRGHEVTAAPAFVQRDAAHIELFAFQWTGKLDGIGRNTPYEGGAGAILPTRRLTGYSFGRHDHLRRVTQR